MKTLKILSLCLLVLGLATLVFAAETKRMATLAEFSGAVEVKAADGNWMAATPGMVLNQGDLLRTKAGSSAILNLDGDAKTAIVQVKENSQLALAELIEDQQMGTQKTLLDLALGSILIKAQKLHQEKSSFEIKTPTSIVGVRGTTFAVSVEAVE